MPVRILHLHSTFALGGKEARAVRLMNAFGDAAEHVVLSAVPGQLSARDAIDPAVAVRFPGEAPPLAGRPGLARLRTLSRYMRGFDLVLTYNWGAFDAVIARRLFGGPPLIHHEDGFNQDETERLKPARNIYRRLGLPAAHRLVVPSERLELIARTAWKQPARRVERIPNGIAAALYAEPPRLPLPGVPAGALVVGTVAGLRPVKNLPRLVRAFAAIGRGDAVLAIVGEGPERERIIAAAEGAGVADRVVLPGFLADPARYVGRFDIFALSSDSEQFPISLVEAMAAGLPAAATAVGDIPAMVAPENRPFIVPPGDEAALGAALARLAADPALRRSVGAANRARAIAEFDERSMIERYALLYGEAIGRPRAFIGAPP